MKAVRAVAVAVALTLGLSGCAGISSVSEAKAKEASQSPRDTESVESTPSPAESPRETGQAEQAKGATEPPLPPGHRLQHVQVPDRANYPTIDSPREDGAAATLLYFFHSTHYGAASGDVAPLESVSHPDCQKCVDAAVNAKQLNENEESFISSAPPRLENFRMGTPPADGSVTLRFTAVRPAAIAWNAAGESRAMSEQAIESEATMTRVDGRWVVRQIGAGS